MGDLDFLNDIEPTENKNVEICDVTQDELLVGDGRIDRPYAVNDPSEYLAHGIISSVPLGFNEKRWWRKLREMSLVYDGMNWALEVGMETGHISFGSLKTVLRPKEKKAVRNWVQSRKSGPIPLRVTILGRKEGSLMVTDEYGLLPILDIGDVPEGLKIAHIYRFTTCSGQKFFRLGWKRGDLRYANGDKPKQRRAKSKQVSIQVLDNLEDSTNQEEL